MKTHSRHRLAVPGTNGSVHRLSVQPSLNGSTNCSPIQWNEYVVADARHISEKIGDQPVLDVTITSPPYWDVKNYDAPNQIGYKQSLEAYLDDLVSVFSAVWKCTHANGSLWIVIKSVKKDGRVHMLPFLLAQLLGNLSQYSWHLQDTLIWHKTHTLPWSHRQKLTDNYEHILCFSKSKDFKLNLDAIRSPDSISNWWVKYPERYHPSGKSLSNVWEIAIPTQGSWGNGHFEHSCPLPLELVRRIILLSSNKGGTVFDPFAGTGSTPLAARALGRRWLATDINSKYRDMFQRRLANEPVDAEATHEKSNANLMQTNIQLRQLKFGILLYKRVSPALRITCQDLPLIFVKAGTMQAPGSKTWIKNGKILFVLSNSCYKTRRAEIAESLKAQCLVAPFSKFQIEMEVEVISLAQFHKQSPYCDMKKINVYHRGEFWKKSVTIAPISMKTIAAVGKLPAIASDILLQENPAY